MVANEQLAANVTNQSVANGRYMWLLITAGGGYCLVNQAAGGENPPWKQAGLPIEHGDNFNFQGAFPKA